MCFSSLFVLRKRRISLETLTFVFPLFFFNACIISREEEMTVSLFFLSLFLSPCGENFFERDGDGVIVVVCVPQRRSNDG